MKRPLAAFLMRGGQDFDAQTANTIQNMNCAGGWRYAGNDTGNPL